MKKFKKLIYVLIAVIIWISLWELAAGRLKEAILLPYPKDVFHTLIELLKTEAFRRIILFSLSHIAEGFGLALLVGILLTVLCSVSDFLEALFLPPLKLIKTVPVASFIILLLLWVDSSKIAIVISFLMVLPVIYTNLRKGVCETDGKMLEMAKVYAISPLRRLRYLYLPATMPYCTAACSVGLSLCWKAGIAAEVIGLARDSIGRQMYDAKLYLDTAALFAWTIVVIALSLLFEQFVMLLVRLLEVWLSNPTVGYDKKHLLLAVLGRSPKQLPLSDEEVNIQNGETVNSQNGETVNSQNGEISDSQTSNKKESATTPTDSSDAPKQLKQENHGETLLTLKGIGKQYGREQVVKNQDLLLKRGSVTVLQGPSGCGKTTLLGILAGLVKPDQGERTIAKNCKIAYVFQEDRLCEGFSAWRNVWLTGAGGAKKSEICSRLNEIGIMEPERKPVRQLSGGQRKRVQLLRALMTKPDLLLLDEPFNGLDKERKTQLANILRTSQEQPAIVIVTHNTSEISYFNTNNDDVNVVTWKNNNAK